MSKTSSFIPKNDVILAEDSILKEDSLEEEINSNKNLNSNEGSLTDSRLKEKKDQEDADLNFCDNLIEVEEWLIAGNLKYFIRIFKILTEKETPAITKNSYISDFFRIPGNFEFFLKFLFEPFDLKVNKNVKRIVFLYLILLVDD